MIRVEQSDIIFVIDEKLIYTDDFVIKFYTVNVEDFFIRKTQADMVETDGKKCIKLDWKELLYIGEGVMNYQAWNNIPDSEFPDSEYNKCVDRTTQYYINSNVIVDPSSDKSIVELVEAIEEDLQAEVTRATERENEIDQKFVNYIPTSEKGSNNGVATLNNNGRVPEGQLQFPTRGQIPSNIDDTNLDNGIYNVNGKVISSDVLNGEQANGVFIQYPYGSKVQQLIVGRAANASGGEQVETYTRRYLSTPQRWTEWNSGATPSSDSYALAKSGNLIQLKKNGVTINSVVDSDTTYDAMTIELAVSGETDAEMAISPNVLQSATTIISGEHFLSISGVSFSGSDVSFFVTGDVFTIIDDFLEKSVYSDGGYENSVQVRLGVNKDYLVMALSQREPDQYTFTSFRPSDSTLHWLRIPNNSRAAEYGFKNLSYQTMTQEEAEQGTSNEGKMVSANVLNTTIQNKIDNNKVEINGTLIDNTEIEFPEGSYELVMDAISKGKYIIMRIDNFYDYVLSAHGDDWASFSVASGEEGFISQAIIYDNNVGELFQRDIRDYDANYNVSFNGSTLVIPHNTYTRIMSNIKSGLPLSQINLYLDNNYLFKISRKPIDNGYLTFEHDNAEESWMAQIEISPNNEGNYSEHVIPPNYGIATEVQIVAGTDNNAKVVSPRTLKSSWMTLNAREQVNIYNEVVIPARLVGNQVEFEEDLRVIFDRIHQFIFNYPELQDRCKIIVDEQYIYNLTQKLDEFFYFEYTNAEESYLAAISLYRNGDTSVGCNYFFTTIPNEPYYKKITAADLTWNNGWAQGGTGDMSRVEFVRYGKVVYVNGTITNETAGANLSSILTIPSNSMFRPKRTVQWAQLSQQNFVVDGVNKVPSYFISIDKNGLFKIEKMNIGGVGTNYQANKQLFISGSYIVD